MAVEVFHFDSIPQDALSPAMKFLLTKWSSLSVMKRLTLQAITESASFNVRDNSTYMIPAGDDFFFMHMGENVRAAVGQDFTGQMLSALEDQVAHDLIDSYQQAVAQEKPIFMRFTSSFAENALIWERLVLPVPIPRLGMILVCYSQVLSHQQEVYAYLFKQARRPWIVTYPIFNGARELDDGWVLLMNDAARTAFSPDRPIRNLRLRDLSLFQFGPLWTALRERYALADPRATVIFDQLELELLKLNHLVAYRFDKAAVAGAMLT
jgi:hypothetical protein